MALMRSPVYMRRLAGHCKCWRRCFLVTRLVAVFALLKAVLCPRRYRKRLLFCWLMAVTILVLHYRILPNSMGYYHEDCHLPETRRERMRYTLRHVVQFLNDENVTYWLDFGTLLGVMREGDVMAHDSDMDVSRLADDLKADEALVSRFTAAMDKVGIKGEAMIAKHEDVQVDMFRWQTTNSTSPTVLRKYYPFVPLVRYAEVVSDFLFPTEIPVHILFPLRQIRVFGVLANIPHRPLDFLKRRYPLTWYMDFPYKWRCWVGSSSKTK